MGITNLRFIVSSRVFKQLSKPCIKPRNIRDWDWNWSWIESDVAVITLIQCKALQWVFLGAVLDHCSDSEFALHPVLYLWPHFTLKQLCYL